MYSEQCMVVLYKQLQLQRAQGKLQLYKAEQVVTASITTHQA